MITPKSGMAVVRTPNGNTAIKYLLIRASFLTGKSVGKSRVVWPYRSTTWFQLMEASVKRWLTHKTKADAYVSQHMGVSCS